MPRRHAKLAIYPNYTSSRSLAWPQSRLESKFPSSIRSRVPGAKSPNKLSVWSCVPSNACYDLRHVGRDFLGHESASMAVAGLVQSLRCRRRCVVFVCVCVCVRTPSCKLVGDGFHWAVGSCTSPLCRKTREGVPRLLLHLPLLLLLQHCHKDLPAPL